MFKKNTHRGMKRVTHKTKKQNTHTRKCGKGLEVHNVYLMDRNSSYRLKRASI